MRHQPRVTGNMGDLGEKIDNVVWTENLKAQ